MLPTVEIQFANKSEVLTFDSQTSARIYAVNIGTMFDAEEIYLDKAQNCYIVTVPQTEIVT